MATPTNLDVVEWSQLMKEMAEATYITANRHPYYSSAVAPNHVHTLPNGGHTAAGGGGGAGGHTHNVSAAQASSRPDRWSEINLLNMLSSRLCWGLDAKCPFRKVLPVKLTDEMVALFVVAGGKALVLEDDAKLYPSDALITQLRLLAEAL